MRLHDDTDDVEREESGSTPNDFTITRKPRRKPGRPRGTKAVTQAMIDALVGSDDPHAAIVIETVKSINPAMQEFIMDEPRVKLGKFKGEDGASRVYLFKSDQD